MFHYFRPLSVLLPVFFFVWMLPVAGLSQQGKSTDPSAVLVFTKTNGYRHTSIEFGVETLRKIAREEGFLLDHTEDSLQFNSKNLSKYDLVVFLSTTGNVLGSQQQEAFRAYVENGGSFMGIHAATDTEYEWPWYGRLVGAYFKSHPDQQEAELIVVNPQHPSTVHIPERWKHFDEWYNFRNINPENKTLLQLDENSYSGGENGANHPMAWYRENGNGRVFYTGLGHTEETFKNPIFFDHLRGGILYCLGKG